MVRISSGANFVCHAEKSLDQCAILWIVVEGVLMVYNSMRNALEQRLRAWPSFDVGGTAVRLRGFDVNAFQFRLNPPFGELSHCSALLNGIAQRYHVQQYRTTLSLKSVACGAALYVTPQGRHLVTEDS